MFINRFDHKKDWNYANQLDRELEQERVKRMVVPPPPAAVPYYKIDTVARFYEIWKEQDQPFLRSFKTFKELFNFLGGWELNHCHCMFCHEYANPPVWKQWKLDRMMEQHLRWKRRQEKAGKLAIYAEKHGI